MAELNISGAANVEDDLGLHDRPVVVVVGEITAEGMKATATKGDVPKLTMKIEELIVLRGSEASKYEARVRKEADARDAANVRDMFPDESGGGDAPPALQP